MENTSGQGDDSAVPKEIDNWNWGAVFLSLIWGIGNKTYVAFFVLVPIINIFVLIALGYNGNKWAWRNKKWESIEHFKQVQKRWTYAGYVTFAIYIFLFIRGLYSLL
ncbi:MAG: ribonuclease G [Balneolaceae bacterium]|nr:MAG: ribonuclease G [Balneolaceae bacterium]